MKYVLLAFFLTFSGSLWALPANVIVEHSVHVGFAPIDYVGEYRFQILRSGEIRSIDNKENIVTLGTIAEKPLAHLIWQVNRLQAVELNPPEAPMCMDAPSTDIRVRKGDGEVVQIWRETGCQGWTSDNHDANSLADTINQLERAYMSLNRN